MISVRLQGKPFSITVIQVYVQTTNAKEDEVERLYEDLWDLLGLTTKKDVLFTTGDWKAKVGGQDIPGGGGGLVTKSCLTFSDPMDCSPPGKSTGVECHCLLCNAVNWLCI